ncbi:MULTISPECIES: M23 family metallopeptidase [unclassified Variovorax]|uniref:M23 family metallopeptidase n=1 Tax=unclassified Variovorax TaxID=663243 RepID=UPI00076C9BCC|nr:MULTISPECIES: M23 family metallopeptidase [unclassified Variovorax]KWT72312.1 Peptidase, M23/M37 family [Variovorax sp. WDL1]PNG53259.1 Murein DD-endopeptidase MepM [Variovorax sp. B2]PNG53831.1 Murein DD-endopeptidase MepM [Variovorax sp. B4]VTV11290.1 Glycyl-glycine endopeptidase ALE-1 precursor [Variovorax sp. WDL1]
MINGILAAEEALASRLAHTFRTYPRQITAAIAALLLSAGGGAFAVASLGPDASELPVKQVFEAVKPLAFENQVEALDTHGFTLFRTEITRSSDTAEALLRRLGIADDAAAAFVRGNPEARMALLGRAGRTVTAEASQDNTLQKLSARWMPDGDGAFKRLVVEKVGGGFRARTETDALTPGTRLASGIVRSSLFAATDDARIPDSVASQLADIFSGDVDFRSLRKGDRFAVVYETFDADGQTLRSGRVLSAEFENNGKLHQALWFQEPGQKGAYYRPNGDSLRRAYLNFPVEFTRVSSGFAARLHPILNTWRQHNGVDYAAPTGTAVRSVGDGTVEFAGTQSGYGNIVIVNHRNNQQTAYAHLSRIDVKTGQVLTQGQTLGAVGSTGWATGPHLHFEFRINGEYHDPTTIAQQEGGAPISPAARPSFDRLALATRAELAAAFSVVQASAD